MAGFWVLVLVIFLGGCGVETEQSPTTSTTFPSVENSTQIKKPDLDFVDVGTQLQIERLCWDDKQKGVIPYWKCIRNELDKIDGLPKPDLDLVDVGTQLQIERLCWDNKDNGVIPYWEGVYSYWVCLKDELEKIGVTRNETIINTQQKTDSNTTNYQVLEEMFFSSKHHMFGLFEMDALVIKTHCERSKMWGAQNYLGCIYRQIEATKNIPSPKLGEVEQKTREVVITSCQFQLVWGIKSFYECLNKNLENIGIES